MQLLMQQMERINKQLEDAASKAPTPPDSDEEGTPGSRRKSRHPHEDNNSSRFLAVKGRKLEIPAFDGKDPDGWILKAERYFTLNRLSQEEKIDVSFISFEGDALRWFQWENKRHPITR